MVIPDAANASRPADDDSAPKATYGRHFYEYVDDTASMSASVVTPIVLDLVPCESVVDVGCGTGAWLGEFQRHGVIDVLGLDDARVPTDLRHIEPDQFMAVDLTDPPAIDRTFSVAVSLEVAEHLPPDAADRFVEFLCSLAPAVLFSAAVPGQGGEDHINEQWPGYWAERFSDAGYEAFDVIRPAIWSDDRVSSFYRQNLVLYVSAEARPGLVIPDELERLPSPPMPLVHPAIWVDYQARVARWRATPLSLSAHLRALPAATRRAFVRRLRRSG